MNHTHERDTQCHDTPTLSQLGSAIATRLQRLGLDAGKEYLAGVKALISPLQTEIANTQRLLAELVLRTASAENSVDLQRINNRVIDVGQSMFISLRSVSMVLELCTAVRDAIAGRALELAKTELYLSGITSEIPVSLIAVGSHGRREQTLFTDQDYLFIHGEIMHEDAASEYFGMLGSIFVKIMAEAGIQKCSSGIMPDNDEWRGSCAEWRRRLFTAARFKHDDWAKNILTLIILSDARYISGNTDLWLRFAPLVRAEVRENSQTIMSMARVASAMRLANGFIRRFSVEAEGVNKGAFNLKLLAWKPLVTCVRMLAVHFGVDDTSTLERIKGLQGKGIFSEKLASGLADSYHIITGRKILQQIKKIKRIINDENYINPYELAGDEREELYKAIMRVAELQNAIRRNFSVA
jgi:signal-transduction protein with cAMP-binding, CBS, and nucleotidyltransferase domain